MKRDNWHAALEVIRKLRDAGHQALLAGGCVRDRLLGLEPKDYDVATDALPPRVRELFPKARLVGVKFGVVLVRRFGFSMEVATFRSEGPYLDGRRPEHVEFGDARTDAFRRDFTINGLFLDPIDDRVIDYIGGQEDLQRRLLRTIGDPARRFAEDHLRMLRAVRFAARLNLDVDPALAAEIRTQAESLRRISPERIWMELAAILASPTRAGGWELIRRFGLRPHLSAEWPASEAGEDAAYRRLAALPAAEIEPELALAALLCDRTDAEVIADARSLRLSNVQQDDLRWLVARTRFFRRESNPELADLKESAAHRQWRNLPHLLRADRVVSGLGPELVDEMSRRVAAIPEGQIAPPPLVTGDDLAAMGLTPGPTFGQVLSAVYREQLNERLATRADALAHLDRLVG